MKRHYGSLLALVTLTAFLHCTNTQLNECLQHTTCGECISYASELCVWCEDLKLLTTKTPRCNVAANYTNNWCKSMVYPHSSILSESTLRAAAQVQPEFYNLKMNPGDPVDLDVIVTRRANYPIDLYYLMDLSDSMKGDLKNLKSLAKELAQLMSDLTSDFQLGFGKFIDKTTWPYVDTYGPRVKNPCQAAGKTCGEAYSFINSQPLTDNATEFEQAIQAEETSFNEDSPEGQFDALLQVIVCTDEIGWRQNAWHLVVVATDEQYHTAGDGRLAGIYTPNNGQCMTDKGKRGKYRGDLEQDYPSVSQIKAALRKAQIIPLFAITEDYIFLYQGLQETLKPVTSFVDELTSNSKDVVALIKKGFEAVASKVTVDIQNENVEASVSVSRCGRNTTSYEGHVCTGVAVGEQAEFKVKLKLLSCIDEPISVRLEAIPFGETLVNITSDCECVCSVPTARNSSKCNFHGTLRCGACDCEEGRIGYTCEEECVPGEQTVTSGCSPDNNTQACSGNGQCDCNHCYCDKNSQGDDELFYGQYCECIKYDCDADGDLRECGGPDRGVCKCGKDDDDVCDCRCECSDKWEGSSCDCLKGDENCNNTKGEKCSHHGVCECNKCTCWPGYDDDLWCEECSRCDSLCEDTLNCVKHILYDSTSHENCQYFNYKMISQPNGEDYYITNGTTVYSETTKKCIFKDEDGCDYTYYVALDPEQEELKYSLHYPFYNNSLFIELPSTDTRTCPGSIDIIPIVIGIVVGIVAVGLLLLLLWWILHKFALHREYLAFKREMASANWNQTTSPLYEPPTKKYRNPAYKKKTMT